MFRSTKKRSKPKSIRSAREEDDDEEMSPEGPAVKLPLKKRKLEKANSANRTVVRTAVGAGNDDGRSRKSKKKKGLGFGGSLRPAESVEDHNNTSATEDRDAPAANPDSISYGKDALSQLKSEQKYRSVDEEKEQTGADEMKAKDKQDSLPGYIPLDGKKPRDEPKILTGEEALEFEEGTTHPGMTDEWPLREVKKAVMQDAENAQEESSAWEAEVTRRAGVSEPPNASTPSTAPPLRNLSIAQLQTQVESTRAQILEQRDDLQRAQQRRETEVVQTRSELQRQQEDLDESGKALEYYQYLRETLVAWVGALRDLEMKVQPIQVALHELEAQVSANDRWQEWEDDTISLLHESGMLDQVLGRQPPGAIFDTLTTVDEFGRDVKSQHVLQREKRAVRRRRIQQQRSDPVRGDESDAFISDGEQEDFRERHVALQKALDVALEELDDEYGRLQNLMAVFEDWRKGYREEYKRTFANLSLADLSSVLIRAELCSLNDPWNESEGYNETKWIPVVNAASASTILDSDSIERIMDKAVVPSILDLLDKSGYSLVSTRQSRSLSTFYRHIQKLLGDNSASFDKLRERMMTYIRDRLKDIAIPILSKTPWPLLSDDDEDLKEALQVATSGQMHRIQKILHNLLVYWAPILPSDDNDEFIECVLEFCSNKLLFLLSSLQDVARPRFDASPADVFTSVWNDLVPTGWLDRPEWMIQSMALRAAATAYGIRTNDDDN